MFCIIDIGMHFRFSIILYCIPLQRQQNAINEKNKIFITGYKTVAYAQTKDKKRVNLAVPLRHI